MTRVFDDWILSQEFNELCYAYRCADQADQDKVVRLFDNIKTETLAKYYEDKGKSDYDLFHPTVMNYILTYVYHESIPFVLDHEGPQLVLAIEETIEIHNNPGEYISVFLITTGCKKKLYDEGVIHEDGETINEGRTIKLIQALLQ